MFGLACYFGSKQLRIFLVAHSGLNSFVFSAQNSGQINFSPDQQKILGQFFLINNISKYWFAYFFFVLSDMIVVF